MPLDMYDLKPEGMVSYLRYNGYHFSKKMCEWAVSLMYKYDPSSKRDVSVSFWDKEKVDSLLLGQGVEVKNKAGYDHVYVAHICEQDGIDMLSEEPCYMMGSLCEKFFKVYD